METAYQLFVSLLTVVLLIAATWYAYNEGYMDPLIEKVGVFVMKAKAEAEAKEMQAEGLKRGEDFLDCEFRLLCCFSTEFLNPSLSSRPTLFRFDIIICRCGEN